LSSFAASAWQAQVYRKISHKLRLLSREHDEIQLLKQKADKLRDLRKKLLVERWD